MSQTETPAGADGRADVRDGDSAGATNFDRYEVDRGRPRKRHRRVASLIVASAVCVLAAILLAGGGWALWMDRVERDSHGFVSVGTSDLDTETYAIVSELRGDGPDWLYGSAVVGDARVRVTSQNEEPVFVGIARTDDVSRYLDGAGYATIEHFTTSARTTHSGGPPSGRPSDESMWDVSQQGVGPLTIEWEPRAGDWSIVLMNADAGGGVDVRGNLSAEFPLLPWLAGGFLVAGLAVGCLGAWLFVRALRREDSVAQQLAVG
jgi:hypothetical protein